MVLKIPGAARRRSFSDDRQIGNFLHLLGDLAVVVIGILIALQINNHRDQRKLHKEEVSYLENIVDDLDRQLVIIQNQETHEATMVASCEKALKLIDQPPYDLVEINRTIVGMIRLTFVASNAVFENLKYSGNLSVISDPKLRNDLMQYYQYLDYAVSVIAGNNSGFVDGFTNYMHGQAWVDFGIQKYSPNTNNLEAALDINPFAGAEWILRVHLNREEERFILHNQLELRGRVSKIHVSIMKELKGKTDQLKSEITGKLSDK